jgi:hypothetical protein
MTMTNFNSGIFGDFIEAPVGSPEHELQRSSLVRAPSADLLMICPLFP